jgi:hypothetical protein
MYRRTISLTHKIPPRLELVDESCLQDHPHPHAMLTVSLRDSGAWIDFKTIKERVNSAIADAKLEGDVGVIDMETYIDRLHDAVADALAADKKDVMIELWETEKYGIVSQ